MRLADVATPGDLMALHARHKMALLARDPSAARALGQLAASARAATLEPDVARYHHLFEPTMARVATVGGHVNALEHLLGHVRDRSAAQTHAADIAAYRDGRAALPEVKARLKARLVAEGALWAAEQTYLDEMEDPRR